MSVSNLKVLHCFGEYLPKSQVWAFELLNNCEHNKYIYGKKYSNLDVFDDKSLTFQPSFFSYYKRKLFFSRLLNKFVDQKWFVKELYNHYLKTECDYIHFHFADIACECQKYLYDKNVPFLVSFYGWDYEQLPFTQPKYNLQYESLFLTAAKLICEGSHGKSILIGKGCSEQKLCIVPLGVKPEILPTSRNQQNYIQIASYTPKKGQLEVLKAVKHLRDTKNIKLKVDFFGFDSDIGYKTALLDYIRLYNLNDQINLRGPLELNQINKIISSYKYFIHPSLYSPSMDCEGGAPTILFYAGMNGLPSISTLHCDIPSVILDGETGWLCQEKDHRSLSDIMLLSRNLPDNEYRIMSNNSRKHILKNYNIANNAKLLDTVYQSLSDSR